MAKETPSQRISREKAAALDAARETARQRAASTEAQRSLSHTKYEVHKFLQTLGDGKALYIRDIVVDNREDAIRYGEENLQGEDWYVNSVVTTRVHTHVSAPSEVTQ